MFSKFVHADWYVTQIYKLLIEFISRFYYISTDIPAAGKFAADTFKILLTEWRLFGEC